MTKQNILYPIVKPVLPPLAKYTQYIESVFDRNWLTNNGPLLQEFELRLADYLNVKNLMVVSNGTLALQVAYAALNVSGKVLTTPFSFAATASSLCWQNMEPHFVDINPKSLNIDIDAIVDSNQPYSALLGVHVFGNPCEVNAIERYAKQHSLKVIYDAAHAFGSKFGDKSLLSYGDASTLSLHATKLFHCVEGGAIIFKEKESLEKAREMINFGFNRENIPVNVGINAKNSEMHAAMGLALLDSVDDIVTKRQSLVTHYQEQLNDVVDFQVWHENGINNGSYMPVLFSSETELLQVSNYLLTVGIQSRRYFYPSLSQVSIYGAQGYTPIANDISKRVLCLPLYFDLALGDVKIICEHVKKALI